MGLMNFKPLASVVVNGRDIRTALLPRLSSISITDGVGTKSDTLEIELTDHVDQLPIALPPAGAEIEVALGYQFGARVVGLYIADEVAVSGPPGRIRITGYAATHGESDAGRGPLTEQRSRSWADGTTIGDLVTTIASALRFTPAVSADAAAIALQHIDQIDESDLSVLTRIARENGLIFKPGGGRLVVVRAGESTSAGGQPLPRIALTPRDVTSWSAKFLRREAVAEVVATYQDTAAGQPAEVRITAPARAGGGGIDAQGAADSLLATANQIRRVRLPQPNQQAAERVAKAEVARSRRAERQMSITLPGRADLMAEGRLVLSGFRPGVNGEWLITKVRHQLNTGGYSCSVECEGVGA